MTRNSKLDIKLLLNRKKANMYLFYPFQVISVNGAESLPDDGLPMGAEATTEALLMGAEAPIEAAEVRATDEDDIGMEMDYDNLMAYFESLKESTA